MIDPTLYPLGDSDCRLCDEINEFASSLFACVYPNLVARNAFLETRMLQVMLPIGPLKRGHILIASRQHALSFGHILAQVQSDLTFILDKVLPVIRRVTGRVLIFEHGPMSDQLRGACCLDHAHLNIIPVPQDLDVVALVARSVDPLPIPIDGLAQFVAQRKPYLFCSVPGEFSLTAAAPPDSSQFFRRIIAYGTGQRDWDWRIHPKAELLQATAAMLEEAT